MSEYKVLARKYRPQSFQDVIGQDATVTTLKNAIKFQRIAHAYLFCGPRGTGKTTLARLFAKALNCLQPNENQEPCNQCSSCKEITTGHSIDVLEIDGASHRGIEDIRQINETVGYAAASGKYKIYIIDEVHMLTKEAFNALLKTLEEPPPKVKFIFATTEPHKILPTIVSRCQRYHLNRISIEKIIEKLRFIAGDVKAAVQEEALLMIANMAEGGLRDAESLFDQILAFHEGEITPAVVASIFGIMPRSIFFELDSAVKEGNLNQAFEIADCLFSQGKDLSHFVEGLIEHFRYLLLSKLMGQAAPLSSLSNEERFQYGKSSTLYTQEQCLNILDFLVESQSQMRFSSSPRIQLEALLMKIIRIHYQLPIEVLVRRLVELEKTICSSSNPTPSLSSMGMPSATTIQEKPPESDLPISVKSPTSNQIKEKFASPVSLQKSTPQPILSQNLSNEKRAHHSITEDPTPTLEDLGIKVDSSFPPTKAIEKKTPTLHNVEKDVSFSSDTPKKNQSQYDTLLQFAAIELEGTIQKKAFYNH